MHGVSNLDEQVMLADWLTGNLVKTRQVGIMNNQVAYNLSKCLGREPRVNGILIARDSSSLVTQKPFKEASVFSEIPPDYRCANG